MNPTQHRLARARRDAIKARARLTGTMIEMQSRLRPAALIEEAMDEMRERASEGARDALAFAKARPATTAGIVAGLLAWLFRDRLIDAVAAVFSRAKATRMRD